MAIFRGWRRSAAVLPLLLIGLAADTGCYDTGDGSAPPLASFYFPVGLAVSHGGTVLYAVNSNFDLQFNGGTIQSYDLWKIRQDAAHAVANPTPECLNGNPRAQNEPLGWLCAKPVDSTPYFRSSAVIGAFATDLLLSRPPEELQDEAVKVHADDPPTDATPSATDRLFIPVRGNATITWASVHRDDFTAAPPPQGSGEEVRKYFAVDCGQTERSSSCDGIHQIGENPNETGNTRHIKMPGEPFGAAISEDGTSLVVTHQNDTRSSLFSTGLSRVSKPDPSSPDKLPLPSIQFVVDDVPTGGIGLAAVPHDPDAFLGARELPRPAFYQTSRAVAQVALLRRYSDEEGGTNPSTARPFLNFEQQFPITTTPSGIDSRGIVIDPTPRLACKARVAPVSGTQTVEDHDRQIQACARKPARAFIANRSPASLLIGEVGGATSSAVSGTTYDPDRLVIFKSVPLSAGPSNVYLAPIVDRDGAYALRVFVVGFDSGTVLIYDPDSGATEAEIRVAPGPFAMAFDPFSFDDVARHVQVPVDARDIDPTLRRFRFGYVASFTNSYLQVLDLDYTANTYGRIIYNVGTPTIPKGT